MAQPAMKPQPSPLPATQKVEQRRPDIAEEMRKAAIQQAQMAESAPRTVGEEDIRLRAYEIYLKRGSSAGGDEVSDWIQAERELLGH